MDRVGRESGDIVRDIVMPAKTLLQYVIAYLEDNPDWTTIGVDSPQRIRDAVEKAISNYGRGERLVLPQP